MDGVSSSSGGGGGGAMGQTHVLLIDDTIRYDTRCYFNVRSNADMSRLNLPHGTEK